MLLYQSVKKSQTFCMLLFDTVRGIYKFIVRNSTAEITRLTYYKLKIIICRVDKPFFFFFRRHVRFVIVN